MILTMKYCVVFFTDKKKGEDRHIKAVGCQQNLA